MLNLNSLWKMIGRVGAAALVLLVLNGCIAYPVIGYRKYTPEFTGKVTARDGTPVSGMKVQVKCYNCFWEGQTNANGVFRVPEQGHWYFFVVESLVRIDIYPKQEYSPSLYDFVFYFEKGNENDFLIGMLHDPPFDFFYQIPTFSDFIGMDLCIARHVDRKIQKEESLIKRRWGARASYFSAFLESYGRTYYYRRSIFFLRKNMKDFRIITDDYVLTLDEALLNYLSEFIPWDCDETRSDQNQ